MMRIRPENDIGSLLLRVASPARYIGGEYGAIVRDRADSLKVALSFPDLYEIGMSNLAIRLLYNVMNAIEGVQCERVFAPAQDFEDLIRARSIPLYTLESGIPLSECDVIGFSVGYELALTSILNILETGQVPLFAEERTGSDPIVIAGGPAITNPAPFGLFLDAVIVGEAEPVIRELFPLLVSAKRRGAGRDELLGILREHPSVWYRGRSGAAIKAVDRDFSAGMTGTLLPVPSIRTVQDHGVIEIMRGCPNGCRFCHAGIFYRPMRMKTHETIEKEADRQVHECGYREITLSSLSTGDYSGISQLVRGLNRRFADRKVSFSLPSLRISSFTLPLLAEVSAVRKSGLTFAVETPNPEWQRGINKSVDIDRTVDILRQAMSLGWNSAKFYFMLGLPVSGDQDESDAIVAFLQEVQERTRIRMNVNVGTFIPKPHTPFQWSGQLREKEALGRIYRIKDGLRGGRFKVGYHSPFLSLLEGILTRGDERAGLLAYDVFRNGARLDAWEEHLKWDVWREAIERAGWDVEAETCRDRDPDETLPWDGVNLGVSKAFLRKEYRKSMEAVLTDPCSDPCDHACGVCRGDRKIEPISPSGEPEREEEPAPIASPLNNVGEEARLLFSYRQEGKSRYLGHLDLMVVFERALLRAAIPYSCTEGFNPKPRLEFARPLALGIGSTTEVGCVSVYKTIQPEVFVELLNAVLPDGLVVERAMLLPRPAEGVRRRSLMSMYRGADYLITTGTAAAADAGSGPDDIESEPPDLERIRSVLSSLQGQQEAKGEEVSILGEDETGIRVRVLSAGGGRSIQNILKTWLGDNPLRMGYRITRTATWAAGSAGPLMDYFEAFADNTITGTSAIASMIMQADEREE